MNTALLLRLCGPFVNRKNKIHLIVVNLLILAILLSTCNQQSDLPYVHLSEDNIKISRNDSDSPRLPLRVAVAAVISPRATLDAYGPLLDYLSEQLERPVQLVQRRTYAEINNLIRAGAVDLAFVCGGAYVEGTRDFGMELLVAPQINGGTIYYSYIIVSSDSPFISLSELRGKSFAFSDPLSNSGHLALQWVLNQQEETPETFFKKKSSLKRGPENSRILVSGGSIDETTQIK